MSRPRPPERGARRPARGGGSGSAARGGWALALLRNLVLWLLPCWLVWALLTPFYNRLLLKAAEDLLHVFERPDVTALYPHPASRHDAYVARLDFTPARRLVRAFRVTDVHFPLVLTAALFLAVPGVPRRERLANLGWALGATLLFDVLVIFFLAKSTYATRLGDWSLAHYGPLARNAYGMAEHLLDLELKLALPFALWAVFYVRLLLGKPEEE